MIKTAISRRLRLELWLLEGLEKNSGEPLSVVYSGDSEQHQLYFAKLAFADGWKRRSLGREWLWRASLRVKREVPSCGLILYEIQDKNRLPFWGRGLLRSPLWLRFELEVDVARQFSGHTYREINRRIRKYGFTASFSKAGADLEDFYHNMYVPHIRRRHGDIGAVQDYASMKKKFLSGGELVLVHREGKVIAAGLQVHSGTKSHFHSLGVRDGDEALLKMGVVEALYYFGLQQVREKGGGTANLGNCRAFFGDGVFRHKLGFGAHVGGGHDAASGCIYFQFLRRTAPLDLFLKENPFVVCEGPEKYHGVVFMDKAPALEGLDDFFDIKNCRGIDEITIYTLDASETKDLKTEKGRRVRIVPASSVLPGS